MKELVNTAITRDAFWDSVPCSTSLNRRFGEPKHRFELVLHSTESQKASLIDNHHENIPEDSVLGPLTTITTL
jgi:hypothetical protein